MTQACVLVKTIPTRVSSILEKVNVIPETKKAFISFGRWDIIIWLDVSDFKSLKSITRNINSLDGVRSTETLAEA